MNKENHTGIKHDDGKPRFSLVPPLAELEVVKVLSFGAEKYAPDNWRGIDPIRYVDAAGRHINAHRRGETADAESRLHSLAHAICCLMFQLEKELESEQGNTSQNRDATSRRRRVTAIRKKRKAASQEPHPTTAGTFSAKELPMIGQDYHYLSKGGVVAMRCWQSTPQEWKRLAAGQVFKTSEACKAAGYTGAYIFHEDDPVKVPDTGGHVWLIRSRLNGPNHWVVDNNPYPVVRKGIGPEGIRFFIGHPNGWHDNEWYANEWHVNGELFDSKERADAKALWRNVSMQRHGKPYGPLHPDAKQSNEPFTGNDEGEAHD